MFNSFIIQMKVIKNKRIKITVTIPSPVKVLPQTIHTGCIRLTRLITNEPAPQQVSYTGNIKLG